MHRVPRPSLTCSRADPPGSLGATATFADVLAYFDAGSREWWIAGIVLFVLVDTGLTLAGASLGSLLGIQFTELNPGLIGFGQRIGFAQAIIGLKLLVAGGLGLMWRAAPWPERALVPIQLTIAGALATGWNLGMLTLLVTMS